MPSYDYWTVLWVKDLSFHPPAQHTWDLLGFYYLLRSSQMTPDPLGNWKWLHPTLKPIGPYEKPHLWFISDTFMSLWDKRTEVIFMIQTFQGYGLKLLTIWWTAWKLFCLLLRFLLALQNNIQPGCDPLSSGFDKECSCAPLFSVILKDSKGNTVIKKN